MKSARFARAVKFVAVALGLALGGYLLLAANGIFIAMRERRQAWHLTPLPAHPIAHIALYVTVAFALQFVSAWLLMPVAILKSPENAVPHRWVSYAARVIVCVGGSILVALVLGFLVMGLLDAGVI